MLSKGDKILVLESGRFAIGWGENAPPHGRRGRDPEGRHAPRRAPGRGRGPAEGDKGKTIKAILVAQIDTASGVW